MASNNNGGSLLGDMDVLLALCNGVSFNVSYKLKVVKHFHFILALIRPSPVCRCLVSKSVGG